MTVPSAHRAVFARPDVMRAAAPAIALGAVAVVLLDGAEALPELRFVALPGARVSVMGLEQAQRQVAHARASKEAAAHLERDAGPGRTWLLVVDGARLATVVPLAHPHAAPIACA